MVVRLKFAALKQGHGYEYLVRFVLGGLATVVAVCGPSAGGSFLAFPAIFGAIAPTTPAWLLVGSTARSRAGVYVRGVRRRVGHARSGCVFAVEASQSRP